ncbi:MAG: PGPGW domain-containing protein [Patescibacteria group bacterium]
MANLGAKRILTDMAGYGCLIAAPLVGWLPGPGGIPLILTGLGLLSINNPWAKRLLHYVRERSQSLSELVFPKKPIIQWAWDIFVILLIATGTLISVYSDNNIVRASSVVFYAMSTTLFLLNRQRLQWLDIKIRKRKQ